MTTWTRIKIGGQPILESRGILQQAAHRPAWADGIDEITCPAGGEPGGGRFLMSKTDFDKITVTSPVDIAWTSGTASEETTVTLKNYIVTNAFAAFPVVDSPLVVTVRDARNLLKESATAKRYNVRLGDGHELSTINGGTAYTWAQLLDSLWTECPGNLVDTFTATGMPSTAPENILVMGESAWLAIAAHVAEHGREIVFDPFESKLTIVDPAGAVDDPPDAKKLSESASSSLAFANATETIRVFFAKELSSEIPHYVDVTTGIEGAAAGTYAVAWGTMLAAVDEAGAVENATDLEAAADEIAAAHTAHLEDATEPTRDVYAGIHEVTPGPGVAAVKWSLHPTPSTTLIGHAPARPPSQKVHEGVRLWRYVLTEDMGATTSGEASASLLELGGGDTLTDAQILDPLGMFGDQVTDSVGYCMQVGSAFFAIQAPCE